MYSSCKYLVVTFSVLLYAGLAKSQAIADYPDWIVNNQPFEPSVTLYAKDAQKLALIRGNKIWYYGLDGKQAGEPVVIRTDKGDLKQPRISPSGKSISYYQESDVLFDDGHLYIFNTDSNYVLGRSKVPGGGNLERLRFSGDSVLQYFCKLKDLGITFRWSTISGEIVRASYYKDTASIDGLYAATSLKDYQYLLVREKDTLAFAYFNDKSGKYDIIKKILLPSALTTINTSFAATNPYLFISDEDNSKTRVYFFAEEQVKEIAVFNGSYELISADGSTNNCMAILKDKMGKYYIANTGKQSIEQLSNVIIEKQHIVETDAARNIFTLSDATTGLIKAFSSETQKLSWQFTPPVVAQAGNSGPAQSQTDSAGLFKVLIKQSSASISNWQYDAVKDRMYVIKNNQFISIDPESQCAVHSETFNTSTHRMTASKILPGNRFIYTTHELWEKETGARRINYMDEEELFEDADKIKKNYPYKANIYDLEKHKIVFEYQCTEEPSLNIINDSLISWMNYDTETGIKTLFVYNLNTGMQTSSLPFGDKEVYDYKMAFNANNHFYTIARLSNDSMELLNEKGKYISTIKTETVADNMRNVDFVKGGPFFYYNNKYEKSGNNVYHFNDEKAGIVYRFPAETEVIASKAAGNKCWFIYRTTKVANNTELIKTWLVEAVSGNKTLLDSTTDGSNGLYIGKMEIYPDINMLLVEKDHGFGWIDMQTGSEYKNFKGKNHSIVSMSYSPDGRYLAAANPDGKVMLWDLGTGKETRALHVAQNGYITKLAFSGDGKCLAASSGDIWETASGKNVVSVTDGRIWEVNSIDFSKDGQRIISGGTCVISWDAANGDKLFFQQYPRKSDMDTTGFCFKPQGCVKSDYPLLVKSTAFHPDSRTFVTGNSSGFIIKWNTENDSIYNYRLLYAGYLGVDKSVTDLIYTRNGQSVIAVQKNCIYKLNSGTLDIEDSLLLPEKESIRHIDMGYDDDVFGCITSRDNKAIVQLRSLKTLAIIKEFVAEGAGFNKLSFSPDKKHVATSSEDGFCSIWDLNTYQPVMYLNNIGEYGNVMVTPDNYYMASKSALESVGFVRNGNYYSFDQFDIYLNRPDIVLKRLGYASSELINFYYSAYLKRLKRSGSDSIINNNIPTLELTNRKKIAPVSRKAWQQLEFTITDSLTTKGFITVFINGNPVLKKQADAGNPTFLFSDSIELNNAANNIEAIYTNAKNVISAKEKISVTYSPQKPAVSKTWFVGIGVSAYSNQKLNLKYPAKDIKDLAAAFKKKYPAAIIDTLLNEKATKENILAIHSRLMKTSVNDKVVVSFNGHGMLSDSLDWYFATYDINAARPETNGLSYTAMENILSGIPARKKLLLIDACHSGEVDKEKDITFANKETGFEKDVKEITSARGNEVLGKSKAGLQTSFEMMQELFANLNNSNGTTVLSAAGGREYALESDSWKNGVFTYSILNALKEKETTDADSDGKISVKELKQAVFDAVKKLTGGRQKPTSRLEVLDDWIVW